MVFLTKINNSSGSEINFLRQAPTGEWFFFQLLDGKIWSPKSVNKMFLLQRNTNQNFWWPDGKFWSPRENTFVAVMAIFPPTINCYSQCHRLAGKIFTVIVIRNKTSAEIIFWRLWQIYIPIFSCAENF